MLTTKFLFIWPNGFKGEFFLEKVNKNCLCFLPSFGSFGRAVSEEKILNQPIRNKNCLWMPCLLVNRDEMSILYRGPSIDASCQVSVHLTKRFHRRRFKKIVQSETRIACGGHVC